MSLFLPPFTAATHHSPPATCHPPAAHASRCLVAFCSASLRIKYTEACMGLYSKVKLGESSLLIVYLGAQSQVSRECVNESNRSVLDRISGVSVKKLRRVLGCVLGGILGSVLRADLGVYSQAGWESHQVQVGVYLRVCLEYA